METSTYGSKLDVARNATDLCMEMRYKLRMLVAKIDGPMNMYEDKQSVVISTTNPSSILKKKHKALS